MAATRERLTCHLESLTVFSMSFAVGHRLSDEFAWNAW
jgi:hypothetical protein